MRYLFLVCLIGLGLSLISFGLAPTPGDHLASLIHTTRPRSF